MCRHVYCPRTSHNQLIWHIRWNVNLLASSHVSDKEPTENVGTWKVIGRTICPSHFSGLISFFYCHFSPVAAARGSLLVQGELHVTTTWPRCAPQCLTKLFPKPVRSRAKYVLREKLLVMFFVFFAFLFFALVSSELKGS